ncbi:MULTISPECIES: hypothetical protein [unclassified Massilia]|uniref:hypothetical protein n=1 Tax=unclassified Massilia TaxID=2609279 RepID=UPI000A409F2B|nr:MULTISPECIES: hypothetical protein [unclassified Massilia]
MDLDTLIDFLQWPAMAVTLGAAFLVGARHARRRIFGFYTFILSNILWIVWGVHDEAWALIALQAGLLAMNLRGIVRNHKEAQAEARDEATA